MDQRDLNYSAYYNDGEKDTVTYDDYHSHNTERLDVEGVKALLMSLPEVHEEVAAWKMRA